MKRPLRRPRRKRATHLVRRAHLYSGLFLLPWAVLYGVNAMPPSVPLVRTTLPREPFRRDRCTWDCHNHGGRHRPKLPAVITGDRYLFGATIRGMYAQASSPPCVSDADVPAYRACSMPSLPAT